MTRLAFIPMALTLLAILPSADAMTQPDPVAAEAIAAKLAAQPLRAAAAAARVRPALKRDLAKLGLTLGSPIFIRAFKEERQLEVFVRNADTGKFVFFRNYRIAGISGKPGPKLAEGDLQVPEGFYYVPPSAMKPDSRYHLAFNIGYPNTYDLAHGRTGSLIMVHGSNISIGCLAMTDEMIEQIYTLGAAAHAGGQKFFRIHLFPFRMTAKRMAKNPPGSPWSAFWANLKQGYDEFERNRIPPDVIVRNGRYHFHAGRDDG